MMNTPPSILSEKTFSTSASSSSVLVVDDNFAIRTVIKDLLELEGLEVHTAENGLQALEILQHVRPNVIILDIRMPVMDGREFRQEQLKRSDISNIPVFIFCAGNKKEDFSDLVPTGLLHKPIDVDDLLAAIQPYL